MLRRRPHNYVFADHVYQRSVDYKYNAQQHGLTRAELWTDCMGTELYLTYLQSAGLINIFGDSIEADPYGRKFSVRLIQCVVVRGSKKAQQAVIDQEISEQVTGLCVRHGTHALSVAVVLEGGGPKGSIVGGEHEFTTLGLYTCPESELAPFQYGTRARIVMEHAENFDDNNHLIAMPATQFIFRGEELVDGFAQRKVQSFGFGTPIHVCPQPLHQVVGASGVAWDTSPGEG